MRRIRRIFMAGLLALTVLFGVAGITAIYSIQQREIYMVQYLAGAVLSEYPQAEQVFAGAVRNGKEENASYQESRNYGETVLRPTVIVKIKSLMNFTDSY